MTKRFLTIAIMVTLLWTQAWAIDGASGIGQNNSKLEIGYSGGSVGLIYDFGLSNDFTVYGSLTSAAGITGIGVGGKYAFINEKKGDDFSLALKGDILIGNGNAFVVPGLVFSKKMNSYTLLGDYSGFSVSGATFSWLGFGGLFDLNEKTQFAAEVGSSSVAYAGRRTTSGLGLAVGVNFVL